MMGIYMDWGERPGIQAKWQECMVIHMALWEQMGVDVELWVVRDIYMGCWELLGICEPVGMHGNLSAFVETGGGSMGTGWNFSCNR